MPPGHLRAAARSALCLAALASIGYLHVAVSQSVPHAKALVRPSVSVTLDGRLDEPIWREAQPVTLTQQSPKPGVATPYDTSVRIIVASDRIYFGFECKDPHPKSVAI